jgi:hypothetical protein
LKKPNQAFAWNSGSPKPTTSNTEQKYFFSHAYLGINFTLLLLLKQYFNIINAILAQLFYPTMVDYQFNWLLLPTFENIFVVYLCHKPFLALGQFSLVDCCMTPFLFLYF